MTEMKNCNTLIKSDPTQLPQAFGVQLHAASAAARKAAVRLRWGDATDERRFLMARETP